MKINDTVLIPERAAEYHGSSRMALVADGNTVLASDSTTTWNELAAQVRMWRNRYPNQRYYVVQTNQESE